MERGITGDLHDFDSTIDSDKVVFSAYRAFNERGECSPGAIREGRGAARTTRSGRPLPRVRSAAPPAEDTHFPRQLL